MPEKTRAQLVKLESDCFKLYVKCWLVGYQKGDSQAVPSIVFEVRIKPSRLTKKQSDVSRTEKICAFVLRFKLSLELQRVSFCAYGLVWERNNGAAARAAMQSRLYSVDFVGVARGFGFQSVAVHESALQENNSFVHTHQH